MRKLLLICLIWTPMAYAKVTFKQAQEVFSQLQNLSGYHVQLKYSKDLESNAWATQNSITINQGMLNDCRNKTDLTMVLGHELGHWIMKDPWKLKDYRYMELRADLIGYKFCNQLGHKDCKYFFLMMYDKYGNEEDQAHPNWLTRLRYVEAYYGENK